MAISLKLRAAQNFAFLRSALLVRDQLGFRRAATVSGLQVSGLSRRVQQLEDELGVSLFQRSTSGIVLTGAGRRYLDLVHTALDLLERAEAEASAAGRGELGRLALGHVWPMSHAAMQEAFRTYRSAAKGVELTLRCASGYMLAEAVIRRELDAALIAAADAPADLDRYDLWSDRWLLARAPNDRRDVGDAPLLCAQHDDWRSLQQLLVAGFGARPALRVQQTHHDGVLSLVAAGAGHAVVPENITRSAHGELALAPLPGSAPLKVVIVWRSDHDNPALRRFLSVLRRPGR